MNIASSSQPGSWRQHSCSLGRSGDCMELIGLCFQEWATCFHLDHSTERWQRAHVSREGTLPLTLPMEYKRAPLYPKGSWCPDALKGSLKAESYPGCPLLLSEHGKVSALTHTGGCAFEGLCEWLGVRG